MLFLILHTFTENYKNTKFQLTENYNPTCQKIKASYEISKRLFSNQNGHFQEIRFLVFIGTSTA